MAFKILFAVFSMSNKMFIGAENEFQISFHDIFLTNLERVLLVNLFLFNFWMPNKDNNNRL